MHCIQNIFLLKCCKKILINHYRYFFLSFILHSSIYGLMHFSFEAKDLAEAFFADVLILILAFLGSHKKLPLLILPSILVKFVLFCASIMFSLMCLSNMNLTEKNREARMEFRRQRNYPEFVNVLLEDHPSVCIWIYGLVTLICFDLSNGIRAFTKAADCCQKRKETEKPPAYSVCVTHTSLASLPPSYSEAMNLRRNQMTLAASGEGPSQPSIVIQMNDCIEERKTDSRIDENTV